MEEQHINPLAVTHLLQYTLRSLCCQDNSQWVYAVFWRILPRNYPPPKWDTHGGAYDRSRGNRRNWILVWEDGFCNFQASSTAEINSGEYPSPSVTSSANYANSESQHFQGLQPELFFKMSHEIYNYGEGLIGKVAADHSHKWIYKEPNDNQEINFLSAWHNSADVQPRTWEAQFQSGIKTIALIAVREGVVQLGAVHKVVEDLSYVVLLRKKFAYIESIPGVLLPHPSSAAFPATCRPLDTPYGAMPDMWAYSMGPPAHLVDLYGYDPFNNQLQQQQHQPNMMRMITPSMSSLEALLSKLPDPAHPGGYSGAEADPLGHIIGPTNRASALDLMGQSSSMAHKIAKEEVDEEDNNNINNNNNDNNHNYENVINGCNHERDVGECSSSMSTYQQHFSYHQDVNIASRRPSTGF